MSSETVSPGRGKLIAAVAFLVCLAGAMIWMVLKPPPGSQERSGKDSTESGPRTEQPTADPEPEAKSSSLDSVGLIEASSKAAKKIGYEISREKVLVSPGSSPQALFIRRAKNVTSATTKHFHQVRDNQVLGFDFTILEFDSAANASKHYDTEHVFEGWEDLLKPVAGLGERAVALHDDDFCGTVIGRFYCSSAGRPREEYIPLMRAVVAAVKEESAPGN